MLFFVDLLRRYFAPIVGLSSPISYFEEDLYAQYHRSFCYGSCYVLPRSVSRRERADYSRRTNAADGLEQLELLRRKGYGQGHSQFRGPDRSFRNARRRLHLCKYRRHLGG